MNTKTLISIIVVAAVAGFGLGYLIYNQTKEGPKVTDELSSSHTGVASKVEILNNIKVITQQSPAVFPAIVSEGNELTKNDLPQQIRALLPAQINIPSQAVTFDSERAGFMVVYTDDNDLYNSHENLLRVIRNSDIEWQEIYIARGAYGAIIDLSSDSYQIRIIQETSGEVATKINLLALEL